SLLAIGIVEVVGEFDKGDVVGIRDAEGHEFARGLTNYTTTEARQVRGLRTEQARETLGQALYDEVVHRDNLVLLG
ncbi:PUA domain-containing protein, partial [Singulisphaera rosea]